MAVSLIQCKNSCVNPKFIGYCISAKHRTRLEKCPPKILGIHIRISIAFNCNRAKVQGVEDLNKSLILARRGGGSRTLLELCYLVARPFRTRESERMKRSNEEVLISSRLIT